MADNPFLGSGAVVAGRSVIPQASVATRASRENLVPMLRNPDAISRRPVNTAVVKMKEGFVAAAPNVKKPGVYLYSENGMHGAAKYFPPGYYPDLSKYGYGRRARSLSIGPGTSVSIYTEANRGGIATQYTNGNAAPFGIADLTIFSNAVMSMEVK